MSLRIVLLTVVVVSLAGCATEPVTVVSGSEAAAAPAARDGSVEECEVEEVAELPQTFEGDESGFESPRDALRHAIEDAEWAMETREQSFEHSG